MLVPDADRAIDWISLPQVSAVVEREIGWRPSRATVNDWAKTGKLRTNGFRPLRTTRRWVLDYLENHRKVTFR